MGTGGLIRLRLLIALLLLLLIEWFGSILCSGILKRLIYWYPFVFENYWFRESCELWDCMILLLRWFSLAVENVWNHLLLKFGKRYLFIHLLFYFGFWVLFCISYFHLSINDFTIFITDVYKNWRGRSGYNPLILWRFIWINWQVVWKIEDNCS